MEIIALSYCCQLTSEVLTLTKRKTTEIHCVLRFDQTYEPKGKKVS